MRRKKHTDFGDFYDVFEIIIDFTWFSQEFALFSWFLQNSLIFVFCAWFFSRITWIFCWLSPESGIDDGGKYGSIAFPCQIAGKWHQKITNFYPNINKIQFDPQNPNFSNFSCQFWLKLLVQVQAHIDNFSPCCQAFVHRMKLACCMAPHSDHCW